MSDDDAIRELLWDAPAQERPALERLATRLEVERPLPNAAFRGRLRRHLEGRGQRVRPRRLRVLIASYAVMGALLMGAAALSVLGSGPLAADEQEATASAQVGDSLR